MPRRTDQLRLCTINVRSIATEARLADFEASVEKIKFDVMGVSETRIPGQGRIDLASGFSLYHSGNDGRTNPGVGFYVPSALCQRCSCYFHSERLIELCIKLNDGSTLRMYEAFLDHLADVIDSKRSKYLVVLGDFNATPGPRQSEECHIGTNAAAPRNRRGQMLADFCEERKLFLANSFFKKRMKDRWTWRNDASGLKKEIDYVLVRSLEGVTDVGVLTSVNVGSDHRMLRCKLRLDRIARPARRFRGFPITDKDLLSSTAQRLLNENVLAGDTIKDYDTLAHIITTATELSTRYEQLPPRLSDRTRNLLQRRRELRHGETGRNTAETIEYAEICKLARRSIQEDLRQRHIQILSHAIHTGRLRFGRMQLLHSKRQLTTLKEATTALSRNSFDSDHETLAHGNPTSDSTDPDPRPNPPNSMSPPSVTNEPDPESQTVRIVKNFYSNLYRSSFGPPTAPSEEIHLQVRINEVHAALMICKPRSAPGSDRITSPSLRILSEILASPIAWFFNDIIRTKAVPPGFAFANTILLYKNGNPTDVTNYRPISLLSTLYKVLTKILTRRLRNTIDKRSILPPEQAGFRRNFLTVDHIHALNIIAEKCYEFNIQLCAAFVDFKKAALNSQYYGRHWNRLVWTQT